MLETLLVPLWAVARVSLLQSAVPLAVAVFVGLHAADAVGLRTPLTNAIAARARVRETFSAPGPASAVAVGIAVAVMIIGLDAVVFQPLLSGFREAVATVSPARVEGLPSTA